MTRRVKLTALVLLLVVFSTACNLTSAPEEQLIEATDVPANVTIPPTRTALPTVGVPTSLPLNIPTTRPGQFLPTSISIPPTQVVLATTPLPVSIVILSPIPGNVVAGNVQVLGAAIHPQFLQYHLEFGPDPNTANLWYPATGAIQNPVMNGLLGIWNTSAVQDGVYQLRLRLVLRDGTSLATVVNNIRVQNRIPTPVPSATPNVPRPIAAFTQNVASGQVPLTVQFTNQSVGTISNYRWDFGDGTFSQEASPAHIFNSTGIFNVILTVTGPGGTSNVSRQINVQSPSAPVAGFTQDKTIGPSPLTVQFADQSTGNITAYNWNFGDGGTSTERNPSHTFTAVGTYNVILTVSGPGGSSIVTRQLTVGNPPTPTPTLTLTPSLTPSLAPTDTPQASATPQPVAPIAEFSALPDTGTVPLDVQFTDLSVGDITAWTWDFGDGGTSTDQNPSHTFNNAGNFVVRLTVTGPGGSDDAETTVSVSPALVAPSAAFEALPTSGTAPLTVQFTDQSTGDIAARAWDFGDGGTSINQNPSYTFNSAGDWAVQLTVTGFDGVTSQAEMTISVTPSGPPPDSSRITFTTDRDGNNEIYVMNADSTNVQNLTSNGASDSDANWSTDGSQIVFVSNRDNFGYPQIYLMNSDGSGLTRISDGSASDYAPAWSSSGQIAFISERDGFPQIYVMNSDGSGLTRISDGSASDYAPAWSSSGQIAFVSERDGFPQIYVMNSDGSGLTRISDGSASDYAPAWSPTNDRITFVSDRDSNSEIYTANSNGTNLIRLTNNGTVDDLPDWAP